VSCIKKNKIYIKTALTKVTVTLVRRINAFPDDGVPPVNWVPGRSRGQRAAGA